MLPIQIGMQGNIGATEGGLPFLEEDEIVSVILEIAEQSPVLSVRGQVQCIHNSDTLVLTFFIE